jgi:hypothetical protein
MSGLDISGVIRLPPPSPAGATGLPGRPLRGTGSAANR